MVVGYTVIDWPGSATEELRLLDDTLGSTSCQFTGGGRWPSSEVDWRQRSTMRDWSGLEAEEPRLMDDTLDSTFYQCTVRSSG